MYNSQVVYICFHCFNQIFCLIKFFFPDVSVTSKNIDSRMGKGKGDIKYWVCLVKPGKILFEISDVYENVAYKALTYGASKLRIKTKIVNLKKFN